MQKIALTEAKIKALLPEQSRYFIYDEKIAGLALAVLPTGKKTFYYLKRHGEKVINKKLGNWEQNATADKTFFANPLASIYKGAVLTLEAARAVTVALSASYSTGQEPFKSTERHPTKELTVDELFNLYMSDHYEGARKRSDETKKEYDRDCSKVFGALPLSSIDGLSARSFHKRLTAEKGPYTANRRVQLMRAMFNKGKVWKLFTGDNPFAEVTLNPEKEREYALTPTQAADLWNALSEAGNSMIRDWGRLAILTGARKTELCEMRWDCLDLKEGTWLIPDSKNGKSRLVALGEIEVAILSARTRETEWVFPSPDKTTHLKDPKNSWDTIRRRVNIPDCTMHDIRKSVGAFMANDGADAKTIQVSLGHADIKTTFKHYRYSGQEQQRQAKAKANQGWLKIAEETRTEGGQRVE